MAYPSDDFQKFGQEQLSAVATSSSLVVKSWQTIAGESTEFSKKAIEDSSAFLEKLLAAKSFESASQIQLDYVKASYEALLGHLTKLSELYSKLVQEAFAPIGTAITKAQAAKE